MRIINHLEKNYTTAERQFRDTVETYNDEALSNWLAEQTKAFQAIEKAAELPKVIHGMVLELGAGRCWFSSLISKYPSVEHIDALDISTRLMTEIAPKVIRQLDGESTKITLHIADFSNLDFLPANHFDTVLFDGAIHHASDPVALLTRVAALLAPGGRLIAIREPIVPVALIPLTPLVRARHGRLEKSHGVTENVFPLFVWKRIYTQAGLKLKALPVPAYPFLQQKLFGGQFVFIASR